MVRTSGAAKLRIGSKSGNHVTRKVNLRNNGDAEGSRIGNHFLNLFLGVESAVALSVELIPVLVNHSTVPVCTDLGKLWIFLDFNAPALILCKMPVEPVELVGCHHVQVFLHLVNAEDMPADIQMHASVCKSRLVLNGHDRKYPLRTGSSLLAKIFCRKHLSDGLCRIAETGSGSGLNADALPCDIKFVLLLGELRVQCELDSLSGSGSNNFGFSSGNKCKMLCEGVGYNCALSVKFLAGNDGGACNLEHALAFDQGFRIRHNVNLRCF